MLKQEDKVKYIEFLSCMVLIVIIAGLLFWLMQMDEQMQISRYPIGYGTGAGDGITSEVTMKSMQDTGWIYNNPYMGAPYGVQNYDATTMELFLNLIQQVLVWITGNWVLAYNLFYLSGYFLCGITAYYAFRKLDISAIVSVPLAVLYTFAPYHLARGTGHIYLGMYFMVPIMCLYLYRLWKNEMIFVKGKKGWITRPNVIRFITLMIMALTGIYYAFFMCFFLCVILLYTLLNDRNKQRIQQAISSIGIIVGSLVLGTIPNITYWIQNGGSMIPDKGANGAELYGLKIIQMLLPIRNHRIAILALLRQKYDENYPLVSENAIACLGTVTAIGFLLLCISLFIGRRLKEESNFRIGSVLTLAAILFGTIGGFSSALSFVTASIRCYNRFSIFIAMFSLIALGTLLQNLVARCQATLWKRIFVCGMMLGILLFGCWDQMIPISENYHAEVAKAYDADDNFVKGIEQLAGVDAMIYQLPYMQNPENGAINQLQDYSHYMGYLHSNTLHWSYGSIIGRDADNLCKSISELPFEEQIEQIQANGYAGIYIDWKAYTEEEKEKMERILQLKTGSEPFMHSDGTRYYYQFSE